MSFTRKPQFWLAALAAGSAFWIAFRVTAAEAPPPPPRSAVDFAQTEIDDAVLERMIAKYAREARGVRR